MNNHIQQLLSISSSSLIAEGEGKQHNLPLLGSPARELESMLASRNGFYAFESALHVFPVGERRGVMDLVRWNAVDLWKTAYNTLANDCFCFAEDTFGMQYCMYDGQVCFFDAETADIEVFSDTLDGWAEKILQDPGLHTGYSLAHQWQQRYGAIPEGRRLLPKRPFFAGGDYTIDNLYLADAVEGMRARGSIAQQIHDLPDGTTIEFVITE